MKIFFKGILLIGGTLLLLQFPAVSQNLGGQFDQVFQIPDKLSKEVKDKASDLNARLTKRMDKYLQKLSNQEKKLQKQLEKQDSLGAKKLFGDAQEEYLSLRSKVTAATRKYTKLSNHYIPHLDSLRTAFDFVNNLGKQSLNAGFVSGKMKDAMASLNKLQDGFTQADEVRSFIENRLKLLGQELAKYGLAKNLKAFQKKVYYYKDQVASYKQQFGDPSKLEATVLDVFRRTTLFKDFFNKNSQLSGLFRLPNNSSEAIAVNQQNLAGLQTRETVRQQLLQKFGSEANLQQAIGQQMPAINEELKRLKDKVFQQSSFGNSDQPMPDFKPNNQKSKSFTQRLVTGVNLQTVKANYFFPSTTDIGLSLGYKLDSKSIVGIGGSYKMGFGKDMHHINITHQGMGVRSFVDYKLKGGLWLSGGAEMNYRSQFSTFEILQNYSAWQNSGLLGLSKKYNLKTKLKGNMQVMYDFLWKQQIPRTQPILFRVGYSLK